MREGPAESKWQAHTVHRTAVCCCARDKQGETKSKRIGLEEAGEWEESQGGGGETHAKGKEVRGYLFQLH